MSYTERFTEVNLIAGILFPANRPPGAHDTDWLLMEEFQRAVVLLKVGEMGQGATVNLVVQQAQDVAGTGQAAIAGKAIAQLTQAGGDADSMVIIEVRTEEMNVNADYNYIRAVLTIANANVQTDLMINRFIATYPPVSTALWDQIVP